MNTRVRAPRLALCLALLGSVATSAACKKDAAPTAAASASVAPVAAPSAAPSAASTAAATAAPTPGAGGLPARTPTTAGPLTIKGYPTTEDGAPQETLEYVGWTGDKFGWCEVADGGADVPYICDLVLADGKVESHGSKGEPTEASVNAAKAWAAKSGLPKGTKSPKLTGTWDFGDITLAFQVLDSKTADDGEVKATAGLVLGGTVDGEKPVFPFVVAPSTKKGFNFGAAPSAAIVSPDGKSLGIIGHLFGMEFVNSHVAKRTTLAGLAASIYNDTGFRHYTKKEYDKAADLFLRGTLADPESKLPSYNLACTYAILGDSHAEAALKIAIERGGDAVKKRAAKDADFAKVKSEPWFTAVTGG